MNEAQKNAIREADNYLKAAGLTPYSELRPQFEEVIRAMKDRLSAGEPVAWSPALNYPGYGRERVWANGKPRQEDIDYWQKNGDGITYAYTHPAPGVPEGFALVPVEPTQEILDALHSSVSLPNCYRAMLAAARTTQKD